MPNKTIYLKDDVFERLATEKNHSKLISDLLLDHWSKRDSIDVPAAPDSRVRKVESCQGHSTKAYCGKVGCPYL